MLHVLSSVEILGRLPKGWTFDETKNSITKEYTRLGFSDAAAFILSIAGIADAMDHHPDVSLHDYKKVSITLTTHDAGGVTSNDLELANAIDEL